MGCAVSKKSHGVAYASASQQEESAHPDGDQEGKGAKAHALPDGVQDSSAQELKPEDLDFSFLTKGRTAVSIPKTEDRGLFPAQLAELVEFLHRNAKDVVQNSADCAQWSMDGVLRGWHDKFSGKSDLKISEINLYQVAFWIIKPLTAPQAVSYVEAIAVVALNQRPKWFCSHWWGEPVLDFLRCIERHRTLRALPVETGYWVCAYANNQHKLDAEIVNDPAQTSFRKAMALSDGTVSVLDSRAVAFTRIWCCYEMAITLESAAEDKLYDVVTTLPDGKVVAFSQGVTPEDEAQGLLPEWSYRGGGVAAKAEREKNFPLELLARSLRTKLQDGQATVEIDRTRILNAIAGRPAEELELAPLAESERYEELNATLRWRFAVAGCELVTDSGPELNVEDLRGFSLDNFPEPGKGRVFALYVEMGDSFKKQSKYALAQQFLEKAVAWKLRALGEPTGGDLEVAGLYQKLGEVHAARNNRNQAFEAYGKALSIRSTLQGEGHLDVASLLLGFASAHRCLPRNADGEVSREDQGLADESALAQFHRALEIRSRALGEEHPEVGRVHIAIGEYWVQRVAMDEALGPVEKGRGILEKALGPDHVEVGCACALLANALAWERENFRRTTSELKRARRIFRASENGNLLELARATGTLGKVVAMQADFPEAAVYLREAAAESSRILGECHSELGPIFGRLATCYDRMRLHEEALESYERAAENFKRTLGPDHLNVARVGRDVEKLKAKLAEEEPEQKEARREHFVELLEEEVRKVREREAEEAGEAA